MSRELTDNDFAELLAIRTSLRRFLLWSKERAAEVGLAPAHHQLLLAIRGHNDDRGPTVGQIAFNLMLRHHSAVQLIDRAETLGLVRRVRDADDRRVVRVQLTAIGRQKLDRLAALHREELSRLAPRFQRLSTGLETSIEELANA
jgi:DNA-binding MarR family transcriptional regulator